MGEVSLVLHSARCHRILYDVCDGFFAPYVAERDRLAGAPIAPGGPFLRLRCFLLGTARGARQPQLALRDGDGTRAVSGDRSATAAHCLRPPCIFDECRCCTNRFKGAALHAALFTLTVAHPTTVDFRLSPFETIS